MGLDINMIALVGSIVRLIFIYKFSIKKQDLAHQIDFDKEEKKDILTGSIVIIAFIIWGILAYVINW
ncbi:hypothetical protein [Chryseobacterium kwangjuense]|uniref:Uncharacterized protein n=1 Tax=Chryseobacterium kwangjuense TaxID=267125 RepID=A0A135W3P0_9FLAO|nr:hypothetical protein [Chryseobacterium kwangjuense]KXH79540.1 hypothetical protein AU378_19410 [Chryseobacterium kwangjuense]